jgi:hypothetical protein
VKLDLFLPALFVKDEKLFALLDGLHFRQMDIKAG